MKTIILMLWGTVAALTAAETNYLVLGTNRVRVVRVDPDGLVYVPESGLGGGKVKFKDLPQDERNRFGYDPASAAAETDRQRDDAARWQAAQKAADAAEARRKEIKKMEAYSLVVEGKVIQKIKEGLLVDSATDRRRTDLLPTRTARAGWVMTNGKQLYSGLCLLTDYKNFAEVVDGDTVSMPAYPNGEFTYTSVNGSARTVRVFTTNMDKVKVLPTAAEWKVICRPLE